MQAVLVGNMLPMRCHKVERMFLIPDGRCTVRCHRGGDMTALAPGGWDFLKLPVSPSPPRRPRFSDPEPMALQAAVSQGATL